MGVPEVNLSWMVPHRAAQKLVSLLLMVPDQSQPPGGTIGLCHMVMRMRTERPVRCHVQVENVDDIFSD